MATVAAELHISEELVTQVRDEVVAMPPPDFRREELPFMQPGMQAFDLWVYEDACRSHDDKTADALRAGMLVAHRILRLAKDERPLPAVADVFLGDNTGKIYARSIWKPGSVEATRRTIDRGYEDSRPGISLLLDSLLKREQSRGGATFLLGLHLAAEDPLVIARMRLERIPIRPHQAHHDRASQLRR